MHIHIFIASVGFSRLNGPADIAASHAPVYLLSKLLYEIGKLVIIAEFIGI